MSRTALSAIAWLAAALTAPLASDTLAQSSTSAPAGDSEIGDEPSSDEDDGPLPSLTSTVRDFDLEGALLKLSLGLELGEASGLSAAFRITDRHEVDGFAGFSLWYQSLVLRADYVFHVYEFVPSERIGVHLSVFGGGGLRMGLFEPRPAFLREFPMALGARVPVGLRATLPPLPAELVATIAPGVDLLPAPRFRLEAALALRFQLDSLRPREL